MRMIEMDLKPSDIVSKKSFENAITVVIALQVQPMQFFTSSEWHNVRNRCDSRRLTTIGERVPVLADVKPSVISNERAIEIGGIQPLMKMLLDVVYCTAMS